MSYNIADIYLVPLSGYYLNEAGVSAVFSEKKQEKKRSSGAEAFRYSAIDGIGLSCGFIRKSQTLKI